MTSQMKWFLPSNFGDIELTPLGEKEDRTKVRAWALTPSEITAMEALRVEAVTKRVFGPQWASADSFPAVADLVARSGQFTVDLNAPLDTVRDVLATALRPGRKLISAVRFSDGSIEQVESYRDAARRSSPPVEAAASTEAADEKKKAPKPTAGTTVAQPTQGCPAPTFEEQEMRAGMVLKSFLTPDQLSDYMSRGQFVATGAMTGQRYLITNRHHNDSYAHASFRALYSLDERKAFCVHDWTVPAPEEMLALMLFLLTPGGEKFLRSLPPDHH